jgi:hypothetical protein
MGVLSSRAATIGLILSVACGLAIYSTISHQLQGVETNATVLAYVSECSVEYQLVSQNHRTDLPLECDAAAAFQKSVGANKAILHRNDFVKLRYVEPGGKSREIKVVEANLVLHDARVGSTVPIVYDPSHPEDARAPLTMNVLGLEFALFLLGLFFLFAGLGMGPLRLAQSLMGGSRNAPKPAAKSLDWSEEAVAQRLRAAAAAAGPSSPPPWQSPSAGSPDTPFASPWAAGHAQPEFGNSPARSFGKRRA